MAISQGIAALPGLSRSGLTIAAGLLSKKDRVTAARYSFLMSIPVILGASMVYPFLKIDVSEFAMYNWKAIIIGTIFSAVSGYLCVKYFIQFVGKYSLSLFGYYCIIVGILTFAFFSVFASGV
jgi:undecaprenyl-diphosphatase